MHFVAQIVTKLLLLPVLHFCNFNIIFKLVGILNSQIEVFLTIYMKSDIYLIIVWFLFFIKNTQKEIR